MRSVCTALRANTNLRILHTNLESTSSDLAKLPSLGFAKHVVEVELLRDLLDKVVATSQVHQEVNDFLVKVYARAMMKKEEWTQHGLELIGPFDKILMKGQFERDAQVLKAALDALKAHHNHGPPGKPNMYTGEACFLYSPGRCPKLYAYGKFVN